MQTVLGIEVAVIRYVVLDRFFDNRVSGTLNLHRGHRNKIRFNPAVGIGVLSKRRKRIKGADAVSGIQKILAEGLALKNELFVKLLFQSFGSFLCADGFVLKCFEFWRDVAFNVFEGLAPAVIRWDFINLAFRDFNEVALNAVEFHSKIGNACSFFFTGLVVN